MKRRALTPKADRIEELADPARTSQLFWARVDRSAGSESCWPWRGYVNPNGYGQVYATNAHGDQHGYGAHRMALMLATGEAPAAPLVTLHSCDRRICCNPSHLRPGTETENAREREERGRGNHRGLHGEANHQAKLTVAQVREIRNAPHRYGTDAAFARRFGVTVGAVTLVRKGKRWSTE